MRYFISLLVFACIAAFWREFVTKKAGQSYDLGLCGIFGIACIGIAIATVIAKTITGQNPTQPTASSSPPQDDRSAHNSGEPGNESLPVAPSPLEDRRKEKSSFINESVLESPNQAGDADQSTRFAPVPQDTDGT